MKQNGFCLGLLLLLGCANTNLFERGISSTPENLQQPASNSTLSYAEKQDFYHLSEGSDIYPYDWLIRIKSAYEKDRTQSWDRGFFEGIESRINLIKDSTENLYLLDYIGLTATWSGLGSQSSDALKSEQNQPPLRWLGSTPSIRLVGVNCAYCHVGSVTVGQKTKVIDGSQGMVHVQRLYSDMLVSTISLLFNSDDQLEKFLVSFDYSLEEAKKLAKEFAKQTLKETAFSKKMRLLVHQIGHRLGSTRKISPRTFAGEEKRIAHHFERLMRLTHRLKPDQGIGNELKKKFEFLAGFVGGSPKFTTQGETVKKERFHKSNDGFTRLEAFVSAGNRIFRNRRDWVSVDAPVGLPSIWGVDKKAIFHYTGNTNATLIRNIGQAVSLGAVILDDQKRTTVKIENITRLEKYSVRMQAPVWQEYFTSDFVGEDDGRFQIDLDRVQKGERHYQQLCAGCHTPKLVGPQGNLEYYPYVRLDQIGTDPNLALNAVKPIRKGLLYSSIFVETMQGILNTYFKDFPLLASEMNAARELDKRGAEWIRESYLATQDQQQGKVDRFPKVSRGSGYIARSLKGIWATAPYLHNNSVPTLLDLLQPASERPQVFERGIGEFDPVKVGVAQRYSYTDDKKGLVVFQKDGQRVEKYNCDATVGDFESEAWEIDVCLHTRLSGNSNAGHEFGVDLKDSQKLDLVEYLKTLH